MESIAYYGVYRFYRPFSDYGVYNAMVFYSSLWLTMAYYGLLCHLWFTMVLWHFPGFADADIRENPGLGTGDAVAKGPGLSPFDINCS